MSGDIVSDYATETGGKSVRKRPVGRPRSKSIAKLRLKLGCSRATAFRRKAAEDEAREQTKAALLAKRERRGVRVIGMAERTRLAAELAAMPLFGCILADPPWAFDVWSQDTGTGRTAESHYPTMSLADICKLDVPAADDCALFLWATAAVMPDAMAVLAAWRFNYKSHVIWAKPDIGLGYWTRNRHELLLIATRGEVPAPAPGEQPPSVIEAPRGRHSEKPEAFAALVERMFPGVPRLEMFARAQRDGWCAWGAEADVYAEGASVASAPTAAPYG